MTATAFEKSQSGQHAYSLPVEEVVWTHFMPPSDLLRGDTVPLPELSEIDLTRHFVGLSRRNVGIDNIFYPLGSCTMKLNPRVNEWCAALPGFVRNHPLAPAETVQGCLEVAAKLVEGLCRVCGMAAGSLTPNAGAQGEFVGMQMIAAYHQSRGDTARTEVLVPDNAHGTNPATAALLGFKTLTVRSCKDGDLDVDHLRSLVSEKTAGLMLTNPNTLGLFSSKILEISQILHEAGGLQYYDGANLNAILNVARPGEMGFDVMHVNLHKTFSTPHGGGGPGSGPVLCSERLKPFLPVPRVVSVGEGYDVENNAEQSIGRISTFHGNFGIYLRAYLYMILHGMAGMRRIAENAVLNANYLKVRLKEHLTEPYSQWCMHEFVLQADRFVDKGIKGLDLAKRMLDYGVHAPTVYFPLIVKECMLVEPTESESVETLDRFVEIVEAICAEAETDVDLVKSAPHTCVVGRLDEVRAVKQPVLRHEVYTRSMQKCGDVQREGVSVGPNLDLQSES